MREKSTAPGHLAAQGRKFYRDMQREYAIADGVGLALLLRASECLDRLAQARRSTLP